MLCYVLALMLSTALGGVIDDNSFDSGYQEKSRTYVIPYDKFKLSEVQSFVKKLEKQVAEMPPEAADEDYVNDLDDEIGYEVEEGIEEAVGVAEGPSYHLSLPTGEFSAPTEAPYPHDGYRSDPGYNEYVDGLLINMVADILKRNMDPIFFRMRNRTHVIRDRTSNTTKASTDKTEAPEKTNPIPEKNDTKKMKSEWKKFLGGGFVSGLRDIERIGDASVRGQNAKQIQSNLTIGPVMLELNVRRTPASIRRQQAKARTVKTMRQIKVTSGVLNGNIITEVNGGRSKLLHFSISPPDPEMTQVTTKGNKSVNNRLNEIGKDIINTVLHQGSFIMKRIRRAAERGTKKQTVDL